MSVTQTGTVLDRIVAQTRRDLAQRAALRSREELQATFAALPAPIDVRAALRQETVSVIAEFKRASPSRGRFPVEIDPGVVVPSYVRGGARMISCLTDGPFFHGSLDDLRRAVASIKVMGASVGVLRKDFMIDRYQVDEARAFGASCILLMASCLDDSTMRDLQAYAWTLGLTALVEVHDEQELERALAIGATMIGINNRNLKTLDVDLATTARLAPLVPPDIVLVGESGISTRQDVDAVGALGVDAVLVGESLILQTDREMAVAAIAGVTRRDRA